MRLRSPRHPVYLTAVAVFLGASVGSLLVPSAAGAEIPLPLLPDLPAPSLPSPADLVRPVVNALFELLFGDIPKRITSGVLHWLLTHPDFVGDSRFDTLERGAAAVRELAYGLAVAFFCAGLARHLFEDATSGALEATRRFVFATAGITLWPWVFGLAIRFSNLATEAFLEVPELSRTTVALLSFAFLASAAVGIGFICGLLAAVLLIALFLEKLLVLTGLTVLYVLMPALIAAAPFPPTAHLFGVGAAALTALLVINPIWTALLAVFALVGEGALTVGAAAVEDFIEPLLAIAMLVLVVGALPLLLRMAWVRGVTAALMTPAAGAQPHGGSALASTITVMHGAQSVRTVLERRSSEQLAQSAWRVEDNALSAGSSAAALPAFTGPVGRSVAAASGAAGIGTTDAETSSQPARGLERPEAMPHGRPGVHAEQPAAQPPEQTRLLPIDSIPKAPEAPRAPHPTDRLRPPLDDPPKDS